jgi:hypothetical protein
VSSELTPFDGSKLLNFLFQREAILVGTATATPISAKNFVFVFPASRRRPSPPGVTSEFVKDMINTFYPNVHPTFREHSVSLSAGFAHSYPLVKTVHLLESDHQYRICREPDLFSSSYSRLRSGRVLRRLFGNEVYMNLDSR